MSTEQREFAWNLYAELRRELTSLQTIRAQVIGLKITFVSATIGLIAANLDKVSPLVFLMPGLASISFDMLVHSYSLSIKRTGFYNRCTLEPILRAGYAFPSKYFLWEEFMVTPQAQRNLACFGTVGITLLPLLVGVIVLFIHYDWGFALLFTSGVAAFFAWDIYEMRKPGEFARSRQKFYRNPAPAVAVLITRKNEILLAKRAEEPAKGKWDLVGGFVEAGESAEEAVVRETWEETGLKVGSVKFICSLPDTYGAMDSPTTNLCFMAEIIEGDPKPQSDVAALVWMKSDNLPAPTEMAFKHQSEVLTRWKSEIGRSPRKPPSKGR